MMPVTKQQLVAYGLIDNILSMNKGERYLMAFLKRLSESRMVIKYEGSFRVAKADFNMYCHLNNYAVDMLNTVISISKRILSIEVNNKPALYMPIFQEVDVNNEDLVVMAFNKGVVQALYFLDDTLIYDWAAIDKIPNNELKAIFIKISAFRKFGRNGVNFNFSDFSCIFNEISYTEMHESVSKINRLTDFNIRFDTPQGVDVCLETGRYGKAILSMENNS